MFRRILAISGVLAILFTLFAFSGSASAASTSTANFASLAYAHTTSHVSHPNISSYCYDRGCDGYPIASCANGETKPFDRMVHSLKYPSRLLYELWVFESPSSNCSSVWGAMANRSGDTLTYAIVIISRTPSGYEQAGPTTVTNGNHFSTYMLGHETTDHLSVTGCVDDIGVSGDNYFCVNFQVY